MNPAPDIPDAGAPVPDGGHQPRLDAAEQSLADALRVSFWALKLAMLVLLVLYLFSGVFNVREQEKAVRLRFGRIVGSPGQQVLAPGGPYFSLPYPLEQVVTVPTAPKQIELDTAFWYQTAHAKQGMTDREAEGKAGPLDPEKDGSLLTGDAEVIHARWSVTYAVHDPIAYLTHVKDALTAQRLVRMATEQAVVEAAAGMTTDRLIRSQGNDQAKRRAQAVLDAMGTGIRVTSLSVKQPSYPLPVRASVRAVLTAETIRAKRIGEAQQRWNQTLVETAGEAHGPLLALIESYELARQAEDTQRAEALERELDRSFSQLRVVFEGAKVPIGGAVAEQILDAQTYRTEVVARVRNEADYFSSLLPQYRKNPRVVLNRLWQDAREKILTGDIETLYLPSGQAHLELNRDPKIQQAREHQKLIADQPSSDFE